METIYSYTRAQAIEDGVLIDLTDWALEGLGMTVGFRVPLAVTAAVWDEINSIPQCLEGISDVRGRAHDLLHMARVSATRNSLGSRTEFSVIMPLKQQLSTPAGLRYTKKHTRTYQMVIGPGDRGEPVITIMKMNED